MIVRAWNLGEGNSGAREGLAAPRPVDRLRKEDVGRWERLGPRDGSSLRKHGAGDGRWKEENPSAWKTTQIFCSGRSKCFCGSELIESSMWSREEGMVGKDAGEEAMSM